MANMFAVKLESRPVNIKFDIDPNIPNELIGDEIRLKEIIINLINNAVKFTVKGIITIKVNGDIKSNAVILKVSISDTGIGIKEKDLDRLFNSFERINSKDSTYVEGTGLGLAITKRLIEIMNGNIYVESVYGEGSTFSFTLPQIIENSTSRIEVTNLESLLNNDSRYKNIKEEKQESFECPNSRILVIDDNEVNLSVAEGIFEFYNIKVDKANSGRIGLDLVKRNNYNIIFIDHMMPELDGIDTLKLIRKMNNIYCDTVPIIALTANATNGAKEMFIDYGFDDYISKPIERIKLEEIIKKYLPEELIIIKKENTNENIESDNIIKIDGIDVKKGLLICNNDLNQYIEILKIIFEGGLNKIKLLKQYIAEERFNDYIIEVHALKSVASSIGAVKLAQLATEHERYGKNKTFNYIYDNFQILINEYEHLLDEISNVINKESYAIIEDFEYLGEKVNITKSELRDKIKNTVDLLDDFESDKALEVLKELFHYNISEDTKEILLKVKDTVEDLEYEESAKLLKSILV